MEKPETERSAAETLEGLDARLRAARERQQGGGPNRPATPSTALGQAWAMTIEMAASLVVGAGIGYGLDRWLGSKPWFLVGFLILGLAAGLWGAVKKAMRLSAAGNRDDGAQQG